jgi:uncharacterized SAM-binding protein YcdF (DUF218 family)
MAPVRGARAARADARFGEALDSANGTGEPREVGAASGVVPAAALLMLQEIPDPAERNRKAHKAAREALQSLQAIQIALLGGGLDRAQLTALAEAARQAAEAADPVLREAAGAIALRAAVELARFQPVPLESG